WAETMLGAGEAGPLTASVDIRLVTTLAGGASEIGFGGGRLHPALLGDDVGEPAIDIARHPLGIAADIEMRAVFAPGPQLGGVFQHPMLDIDLLALVAREGGIEPGQEPVAAPFEQLVAVQE